MPETLSQKKRKKRQGVRKRGTGAFVLGYKNTVNPMITEPNCNIGPTVNSTIQIYLQRRNLSETKFFSGHWLFRLSRFYTVK